MKYLGPLLTLSLYCLPALASYPDEINYPYYQNIFQNQSRTLSQLTSRYQNLDLDTRNLFSQIQGMQQSFNNGSNEIVTINSNIRRLSDESRQLTYQRDTLIRNERDLANQANRAKNDYDRLKREVDNETRRLGPLREQMSRTEFEVRTARNNQSQEMNKLRSAENELRNAQNNLSRVRSDISRLESTPNRTPSQQSQLDNLNRNRSSLESEISRKSMQVSQLQGSVNQLARFVSAKENELRNIQTQYQRENQRLSQLQISLNNAQRVYNDYLNRLNATRTSLTNTERRISSIRTEVTRFESRKRDVERSLDSLRYQIETSQRRYSSQVSELNNLGREVERQKLSVNDAQYEFQKRASLYNEYLAEAQALGRSQVMSASTNGSAQGQRDAQKKGLALGQNTGTLQGKASGNLWGAVRAEVTAYHEGYQIGYNLPRTDAHNAADKDAAKDAKAFVESMLRPSYFEEVVQAEIKKPFFMQKGLETAMFFKQGLVHSNNNNLEITDQELAASDNLETDYDQVISGFKKEKILADENLEHTQNAVNSYTQQEKYPFDKVSCSNVYKGVASFKEACETSFYNNYASTFEDSAYESYLEHFTGHFNDSFESSYERALGEQYKLSYARAFELSLLFGKEEGRKVMYSEAYEEQYKISYANHLELEKKRVKSEVVGEFSEFLDKNPLLTMTGLNAPSEIIAGDTITVNSLLRNLGRAKAGIAHLNITKVNGAEIINKKTVTGEIGARTQKEEAGPVVRVLPDLVTGQTVSIEVEATLPGDNYKSSRVEKMVLERKVSISPLQDLKLNVDQTPAIRSVLRRFLIHSLSVDVTPRFEDLKTDLEVRLVALSGGEHVELKVTSQTVGKMSKGSKKNIKFSYVFKDSASGKDINLSMQFLYKGRVVQTENIVLRPH